MAIGNPISLTSNVATKAINVIATASQTSFTVTGGYRLNELSVFRNGVRLVNGRDFTARDGLTVTLLSAATEGDVLEFQVFDTFRVADAITPFDSAQTIAGDLSIVGVLSATQLGSVNFNLTSGIQTFHDVRVGGALTVAGTLTYEDTTNTTNTGLSTFSGGMNISGVGATITTLNVTGVATVSNNISIGDSIFHIGDGGGTTFGFPAADTFTVYTDGSERFRVTSAGRVGINETDPDQKLHILDTAAGARHPILLQNRTNDDSSVGIQFIASGSDLSDGQFATIEAQSDTAGNTKHDLLFKTVTNGGTPTERVRIDSSGRLLVGANSSSATSSALLEGNSAGGSSTGTLTLARGQATPSDGAALGQVNFTDNTHATAGYIIGQRDGGSWSGSSLPSRIVFGTTADSASSPTERLRITSAGKVGVNETAPAAELVVKQSGSTFTTQSQTVALFQRSSTTGHGAKIAIVAGNAASSDINFGDVDDEDAGLIQYVHSDNAFKFCTNGDISNEKLRITSAGLVRVPDDGKFTAGAGDDLEIYHDGTDNFIKSNAALKIQAAGSNSFTVHVSARTDKETIKCYNNTNAPYVELFYDNSKKLETTSAGVTVTGTLNATTAITQNGNALATNGKAIAMALIFG